MSRKVTITLSLDVNTLARINALAVYFPKEIRTQAQALDMAMRFALSKIGLEQHIHLPEPDEDTGARGFTSIQHKRSPHRVLEKPGFEPRSSFEFDLLAALAERLAPVVEDTETPELDAEQRNNLDEFLGRK